MVTCPLCGEVEEEDHHGWLMAAHIRVQHLGEREDFPVLCWCGMDLCDNQNGVITNLHRHLEEVGWDNLKAHIEENIHVWLPRRLVDVPA